ncbi:uncharacterized protein LOC111024824 [Momordica charantia]|uniref:Uncharacterized protein LOC111024824 n=1 Tax=Momordica charantia TaxID=3673 RepID=A0A6J1DZ19_MOMCH|nr:uncharacterized protein LOC111024824 [Momordica charantia]
MNINPQDPPHPPNPPVDGDRAGEGAANRAGEVPNPILLTDNRDVAVRNYVTHAFHNLNSDVVDDGPVRRADNEDPYSHLKSFIEIANAFQLSGVSEDALRLKMNADLREDIVSFRQKENEAVQEPWERFKELLRRCLSHGLPTCVQIEQFYRGLDRPSRMMLNTAANDSLFEKSISEIIDILNKMTDSNDQGEIGRSLPKKQVSARVFELDTVASMQAQMATINQMLKQLTMEKETKTATSAMLEPSLCLQISDISCVYCGDNQLYENCPANPTSVFYVGQRAQRNFNPYSNTYDPRWRNHPNFSWSNQGVASSSAQTPAQQYKQNYTPPDFPTQPASQPQQYNQQRAQNTTQQGGSNGSLEAMRKEFMTRSEATTKEFMTRTDTGIRKLEMQVGQIANDKKSRPQGTLPGNTENPK